MEKAAEAFRTISEAASELDVPQHVLRFWETRFSQIRPMKRAGGRRYYRPQDIDLLRGIRKLLYDEGYTIKGVQKILREHGVAHVVSIGRGEVEAGAARPAMPPAGGVAQAGQPTSPPAPAAPAEGQATQPAPEEGAQPAQSAPQSAQPSQSLQSQPRPRAAEAELSAAARAELQQAMKELAQARDMLQQVLKQAGEHDSSPASG